MRIVTPIARVYLNIATPNHADNNATIMHTDNVAVVITYIYIYIH
jgi:hypothetical protein